MRTSSHHLPQPPRGSPAPPVGLFARAQLYIHEGRSGTVILAHPLPALHYRWDLSLHLWTIRLAQHGTERAGAHLSTESPTDFSTPLQRRTLEKIVCSPHCFVQINPVLESPWQHAAVPAVCQFAGKLYSSELNFTEITTWDKSSIMHLWKWAWVEYEKDSRFQDLKKSTLTKMRENPSNKILTLWNI